MKDVTSPVVYSVAATTSKTFTISTSEPIAVSGAEQNLHVLANIKIDGVGLVGKITPNYANNTLTVELGTGLSVGDHPVTISNLKDIAGFVAPAFEGTLTVLEDKATANITGVTFVDKDTIKVKFDEPVNTLGTVTVDGAAIGGSTASADKTEYTLTLGSSLGLASLIKATISYNGTVDMEGNTITTAKTFEFASTDDLVAPTVTLSLNSSNKVVAVFSETMSAPGTLTVKDANGTTVAAGALVLDATDTTKKTYISANAVGATAGAYTVELKDSADNSVRANKIITVSVSLQSNDITAPTVSQVVTKTAYSAGPPVVNGQATIYFSEAMDVTTITNLTNYLVDFDGAGAGAAVQLSSITNAAASASADGKSVVLTIPGASYLAGTTTVAVLAVKDQAAQLIATADFNSPKTVQAAAPALTESGFEMVARNQVKVTFNNQLVSVDPSDFKVYKNDGTSLAFVGVAYTLDSTQKIATITLNGNLDADGHVNGDAAGLAKLIITAGNTKDIYGNASAEAATTLVDKVAPTATIAQGTVAGEITITFNEAVNAVSEATLRNDLIVRNKDGVLVTLDDNTDGDNTGTNVVYSGGGSVVTNFTKITFTGNTAENYTFELIARNIKDLATAPVITNGVTATTIQAK